MLILDLSPSPSDGSSIVHDKWVSMEEVILQFQTLLYDLPELRMEK